VKRGVIVNFKSENRYSSRVHLKIFVLLVIAVFLTACTENIKSDKEEGSKHVNFRYNFSTNSLDPHVDSSYVPLRAGITETLLKLDEENITIAPWLAVSWSGEDGINWVIDIRKGITFHNGKKMDADAVKLSLQRALKESVAIQNALKIFD
jgi:peptide/nickel transport system substrate-binding protein